MAFAGTCHRKPLANASTICISFLDEFVPFPLGIRGCLVDFSAQSQSNFSQISSISWSSQGLTVRLRKHLRENMFFPLASASSDRGVGSNGFRSACERRVALSAMRIQQGDLSRQEYSSTLASRCLRIGRTFGLDERDERGA